MDADMNPPSKPLLFTGVGKLLSEGSLDLLIHIQKFLNPADILALRSTCKHLSDATRSRTVWMNAVRNVGITQGVFLPSFPLQQMSLDDLEHLALSPRRLWTHIKKAGTTTPFLTRVFTPHMQRGAEPVVIDQLVLVPGGRFLLTSNRHGSLSLWDIGFNAGANMKLFPIATLVGSRANSHSYVANIGPAPNSSGLYIFMKVESDDDRTRIFLYEIYPTSETPTFSQLGTFSIRGILNETTISQDYFVGHTLSPTTLTVWKYTAQELGASWVVDTDTVYNFHVFGENIITFQGHNFLLWTIPELQPLVDGYAPVIELGFKLALAYPFIERAGSSSVALSSCWLPELVQNQFGLYSDSTPAMTLYSVKSVDTSREPDLPEILPLRSGSVQSLQSSLNQEADFLRPLHVTEDGYLQVWSTAADHIIVDVIPKPSPGNPTFSSVASTIWTRPASVAELFSHDFCPMTGRLVVHLGDSANDEVRIMDFILPRSFL